MRQDIFLPSVFILAILLISFILIDENCGKTETHKATLIDKQYNAEQNSIGSGYGMTTSGQSGMIITSSHEDEKFILIVKTKGGAIKSIQCTSKEYYSKQLGQTIEYNQNKGYFTNKNWKIYINQDKNVDN